jgi:hypothetical protein
VDIAATMINPSAARDRVFRQSASKIGTVIIGARIQWKILGSHRSNAAGYSSNPLFLRHNCASVIHEKQGAEKTAGTGPEN